jgi:hypothetical protein
MSTILDSVLEGLLEKMEPVIPKEQLHKLIVKCVHGELSSQQSMDAADMLTSDLALIINLTYQKRKEEFEKNHESDCIDRLQNYKDRITDLKLTNAHMNGRLITLASDTMSMVEPAERGHKERSKKVEATPSSKSYGGKGLLHMGRNHVPLKKMK